MCNESCTLFAGLPWSTWPRCTDRATKRTWSRPLAWPRESWESPGCWTRRVRAVNAVGSALLAVTWRCHASLFNFAINVIHDYCYLLRERAAPFWLTINFWRVTVASTFISLAATTLTGSSWRWYVATFSVYSPSLSSQMWTWSIRMRNP